MKLERSHFDVVELPPAPCVGVVQPAEWGFSASFQWCGEFVPFDLLAGQLGHGIFLNFL
jgi:hypothetical protein